MFRIITLVVTVVLLCTFFSACDEPEPDTDAPEITVISPTVDQTVARTLTVAATAGDRDSEVSMQVFLDGNLLQESTTAEISIDINTQTLSEGDHEIKVTAADGSENNSEVAIPIEVRNILFKAQISSNYVPEFTHIYYALSKNDGTLMAFTEIENDALVTVATPADFDPDSTFVLTEYFYLNQPPGYPGGGTTLVRNMNTYAGLNAGEFSVIEYLQAGPIIGTHHVEISEVPTEIYNSTLHGSHINSTTGYFGNEGLISADLGMNSNTSDFFFGLKLAEGTAIPTYKYIPSIAVGGSTQFSFTGLPQYQKVDITTREAAGPFNYSVSGVVSGNFVGVFTDQGWFDNGKFPVFYPATTYPQYAFDLNYRSGDNAYNYHLLAATPPTTYLYLDASATNVNYSNRQLKVVTKGNFDVMSMSGSSFSFEGNDFTLDIYGVSFPNGTRHKVTFPTTPAALIDLGFTSPTDFAFVTGAFFDYADLSGTEDYQTKIVFNADNLPRTHRTYTGVISSVTPTNNNGRLVFPQITVPKHIESVLLDRLPLGMKSRLR